MIAKLDQPVPQGRSIRRPPDGRRGEDPSAASSRAPVCGASVSSEQDATPEVAETTAPSRESRRGLSSRWLLLIGAVIVFNIVALILVPPFPKGGNPGDECLFPVCFIDGTLEFPAPHVVWAPPDAGPAPTSLIVFYPSISSTILTMWIVMAIVLVAAILMTRGRSLVPGPAQNAFESFYEFLSDFGVSIAGAAARPYIPLFAAFFLLILFCNWSGLVPPVGRIEELRAPTSDVNVTIGLALVSFLYFEFQGFRQPRRRRLSRQVLPALRVQERDRRRGHRPVRRARRAHARVRQAGHAVDATLRQHLRRRGGARRHHRADHRLHPGRPARPRGHAQRDPGADLQRPDPHVHHPRHREPRARGGPRRRGGARGHPRDRSRRRSSRPTEAPVTAQPTVPDKTRAARPGSRRNDTRWSTSAPDSPPLG